MKIIATYNIKGGVGKTATAINLAYLAAREGAPTLVWDLDPQGAASYYFRINPKFDVPAGPHEWLGRTIIVGGADRHRTHSIFTYYAMV